MDKYQGPTIYGIGNYIQYPVKNHNGKEYKGEYVCSPSYWITFAAQLKLTQLCKSTILQENNFFFKVDLAAIQRMEEW